jgi:hypothetical protein
MWDAKVSGKSDMSRFDAAAALSILVRQVCERVNVYSFNEKGHVVPSRSGFALRDALAKTQGGYSRGGLGVQLANQDGYDRIIVITDGQWHPMSAGTCFGSDRNDPKVSPPPLTDKAYLIDVSVEKNGVGYGKWTTIHGWSESILGYIQASEAPEPTIGEVLLANRKKDAESPVRTRQVKSAKTVKAAKPSKKVKSAKRKK